MPSPTAQLHNAEQAILSSRARQRAATNIGPCPAVANPDRRADGLSSTKRFIELYFRLSLPWSNDQIEVMELLDDAEVNGGLIPIGMPRAGGKSTIARAFATRVVLKGVHRFVMLLGATSTKARQELETIKKYFLTNRLLSEDFPEVCHPIRCLEGRANRAKGQHCEGAPTYIQWGREEVVLPYIDGSQCSESVLRVSGLDGAGLRGQNFTRSHDGVNLRPTLVILDDPQTKEALDIETPIPTPRGFVRMGDLQIGDTVFDENGVPSAVVGTSPIMEGRESLRIGFDDGSFVYADSGHLWTTSTALQRTNARRKVLLPDPSFASRPQCQPRAFSSTLRTSEIGESLLGEGERNNHSIPLAKPFLAPDVDLPIPPYVLGVWLGDGAAASGRICTADSEILEILAAEGFSHGMESKKPNNKAADYTLLGLRTLLRRSNLLNNKHLPEAYWFSSPGQRLAVLQGLMDTDGNISSASPVKGQRCLFSNTNSKIIEAVMHLCRSLGIKAKCASVNYPEWKMAAPAWSVTFITSVPVFRLSRKKSKLPATTKPNTTRRYICSVDPCDTRPVKCIAVSSPSKLYLCGKALIPTHNSARSAQQCDKRHDIIHSDILGMVGPGETITLVCPCTKVERNDLADRLFDPEQSPLWTGRCYAMLKSLPENMELWEQYFTTLRDEMRNRVGKKAREHAYGKIATQFYVDNRAAMDAGALASWPESFKRHEVSAIQSAMNILCLNPRAFWAEYMNDPMHQEDAPGQLKADEVEKRGINIDRFLVPVQATKLVAAVDVQHKCLYYGVGGFQGGLGGHVVDYGTWPDQGRRYFKLSEVQQTIERAMQKAGINPGTLEGQIKYALDRLSEQLLGRAWSVQGGETMRIERMIVDAGDEGDAIKTWCLNTPYAALVTPWHGRGVKATSRPWSDYPVRPGETMGFHTLLTFGTGKNRIVKHLLGDSNYWKSLLCRRLQMSLGDKAAITLFKPTPERDHRNFAEHMCAEYFKEVESEGRKVNEWEIRAAHDDNHWFDVCVMMLAGASFAGIKIEEMQGGPSKPRRQRSAADYQKAMDEYKRRTGNY